MKAKQYVVTELSEMIKAIITYSSHEVMRHAVLHHLQVIHLERIREIEKKLREMIGINYITYLGPTIMGLTIDPDTYVVSYETGYCLYTDLMDREKSRELITRNKDTLVPEEDKWRKSSYVSNDIPYTAFERYYNPVFDGVLQEDIQVEIRYQRKGLASNKCRVVTQTYTSVVCDV